MSLCFGSLSYRFNHIHNKPYQQPCQKCSSQIASFMWPAWGPPGSCRPHVGPMLAPWTLLSGLAHALHWDAPDCLMQKVFPCHDIIMHWCNRRHYVCIVYSTYVHIIAGSVMMRHWLVLSNIVKQSLLWYRLVQFAVIEIGTAQFSCNTVWHSVV